MENDSDDEIDLYAEDQLEGVQEDNTTRVYFQNLNGLKWDTDGGTRPVICQTMAGIHANIACFSEVKQDTSNFSI